MFKIKTGFQEHQFFNVGVDEIHKAYFAFLNENTRVIFKNGNAVRGSDIIKIEPNINEMMGWLPDYKPVSEDFMYIENSQKCKQAKHDMEIARNVVYKIDKPELLQLPMYEVAKLLNVDTLRLE